MTPAATATYLILTGGGVGAFIAAYGFSKTTAGRLVASLGIVTIIGISALIFYRVAS